MSTTQIFKKQVQIKHEATPDDKIYLHPIRLFCHLCKSNNGPTKVRQNLWQLTYHYKTVHFSECQMEWQEFVSHLEQIIKLRIIR